MARELTFKLDVSRFIRNVISKAPAIAAQQMRAMMRDIGRAFKVKIQRERLRGKTGPSNLGRRSGALARSLGFVVKGTNLNDLIAHVGFGPPSAPWFDAGVEDYAFIHETGGTVHAQSTEHLAIPVADNLSGVGLATFDSPLDLADARFVPWVFTDGDDGFLVFADDGLFFILKHTAEIPPRLHFADDWVAFQEDIRIMLNAGMKKMVKKIEGKK